LSELWSRPGWAKRENLSELGIQPTNRLSRVLDYFSDSEPLRRILCISQAVNDFASGGTLNGIDPRRVHSNRFTAFSMYHLGCALEMSGQPRGFFHSRTSPDLCSALDPVHPCRHCMLQSSIPGSASVVKALMRSTDPVDPIGDAPRTRFL
jgi:hypothetical protein